MSKAPTDCNEPTPYTVSQIYDLARAFDDADVVWMRAISVAFPRLRAGDVRYTAAAKGLDGSALRAAYDSRNAASDAWHTAIKANRDAGKPHVVAER